MPAKRPTTYDVARVSGLSRATVSYVLNDTPGQTIPESTRQRVLDAAKGLGYTPMASARSLRRGRSDIVLFLVPEWSLGHPFTRILERLSVVLAESGLTLVIHIRPRSLPLSELWRTISPAAVMYLGSLGAQAEEELSHAQVGAVIPIRLDENDADGAGVVPQERGARLQVQHLATRGLHRLGYAASPDPRVARFAVPRQRAAAEECVDLGLDAIDVRVVPEEMAGARLLLHEWLDRGVTGVCAYNDEIALQLLAAAKAEGIRVPDDLAIVGMDDIPDASWSDPGLTTVGFDHEGIADVFASQLVAEVIGEGVPLRMDSSTVNLVVRGTA